MAEKDQGTISKKSYFASLIVLACLIIVSGILTYVIPAGTFQRTIENGSVTVVPNSYKTCPRPNYPIWRWFTSPFEVLASEDAPTAIVIIIFLAVVSGAFAILRQTGIMEESIKLLAKKFRKNRKAFLAVICLFSMSLGSFMGIFEESVPLVPLAIGLSLSFGWDIFVGLGMSILAVGFGFAAAVSNPFSVGTAQKLAEIPMFSGSLFRLLCFVIIYVFYISYLLFYVNRLEKKKPFQFANLSQDEDAPKQTSTNSLLQKGVKFFGFASGILAFLVVLSSVTHIASDFILPLIALGFLVIGLGSGLVQKIKLSAVLKTFAKGSVEVLPAALLILMALGVKRIVVSGGIMDTVLFRASTLLNGSSKYGSAAIMYGIVLLMNFFIGSASAKAFLLIPVLAPLADLSGVSRQIAVTAFTFGDGFSNMLYPTNAVLLISLGLANISWATWFKKTWLLQLCTIVITLLLLMLSVAIGYN